MSVNPGEIIFGFIAFLFAISFHEAAHAWTANRCGDPTAKMLGRITLNPIKHIDIWGTLLIPIIGMMSGIGFIGWAKPTPVDPRNFRRWMRDDILVSVAGPASNILLMLIFGFAIKLYILYLRAHGVHQLSSTVEPIILLLVKAVEINVILAIFNMIPVPPLDGSHVLRHFLSGSALATFDKVGTYGLMLLFVVNMYYNFLGFLFRPAYALVDRMFFS
jgi:Zn-dependent protease